VPDIKKDIDLINREIHRAANKDFSGDLKIDLQFRNGGIAAISINLGSNLKGNGKKG